MKKIKDPVSGFSHLIGVCLAVLGTILLLINSQNSIETISFLVFGITIFILYSSSTVYHLFEKATEKISYLRKIDHATIYLLIAGTYVPFCLLIVEGVLGKIILILIWILAILGISATFSNLFWKYVSRKVSTLLYIFMGLISLTLLYSIRMFPEIILWLSIGGIFYITGAVIYAIKKPNLFKGFGFHELFHIFVLLGTFSHFWCIYRYIAIGS